MTFVRALLDRHGYVDVKIDYHGHMDRGLGIWNAIAAFHAGADRLHGFTLGIGERVFNVAKSSLRLLEDEEISAILTPLG